MAYRMGQGMVNRMKSRGQSAIDGFLRLVMSLRTGFVAIDKFQAIADHPEQNV